MFKLSILAVLEIHAPYEIKASRSLNLSFEAIPTSLSSQFRHFPIL